MTGPVAGARITGDARTTLAAEVARRYLAGEAIRPIATSLGRSYGFVQTLLVEAGVATRTRGGDTRSPAARQAIAARTTAIPDEGPIAVEAPVDEPTRSKATKPKATAAKTAAAKTATTPKAGKGKKGAVPTKAAAAMGERAEGKGRGGKKDAGKDGTTGKAAAQDAPAKADGAKKSKKKAGKKK